MGYKFISEQEPSDEDLAVLVHDATQLAMERKKKAQEQFNQNLHTQIQNLRALRHDGKNSAKA